EPGAEPRPEGQRGDQDDDRHEDPRDAVGQALDLGLAGLGVLDELRHLSQLGVGTDARSTDHETPAGVDGGTGDGVPLTHLDGNRLPGEHGGTDRRGTGAAGASWVSEPMRVARTTSRPPALTVAPVTASPSPTSTGTDSPVSMEASTAEVSETTVPSVAIFSPGRTMKSSPSTRSSMAIFCSWP